MTVIAAADETALAVFAIVVGVTMPVTYFASKRVSTATDFLVRGTRSHGFAERVRDRGDYMSAASFLESAGSSSWSGSTASCTRSASWSRS